MTNSTTDFLELFRDESEERLDSMVDSLLRLERGSPPSEEIDSLFRQAHTIKGAASMLGLQRVQALAHAMEDLLSDVRTSQQFSLGLTEPLLRGIDSLRRQIAGEQDSSDELLAELSSLRDDATRAGDSQEAAAPAPSPEPVRRRSIHVPAEKIDHVVDLVAETTLHRSRLEFVISQTHAKETTIVDELDIGDRLMGELREAAIGMRTLPLSSIVGSFPRAVRDLAVSQGKEIELELIGTETELDRTILESLPEIVTHLLRNAVAHGIELPPDRLRAGKPSQGTISLTAEQRGGEVEITITDDGRGVSDSVLAEAGRVGSLTDVLTRSGFTTAQGVTELAGRGVGLDVVRARVEEFGGRLEVRSRPGEGTSVALVLPLALALLDVLLVERDGRLFGLPLSAVQEVLSIGKRLVLEGKVAIDIRGSSVPLFDLAEIVGAPAGDLADPAPAAVVAIGERRAVLACDRLVGQDEVVVKPLGLLKAIPGYLGGSILGDGRIALLLDLAVLLQERRGVGNAPVRSSAVSLPPKVLVVEDFFTVRELQRSILEAVGYRVVTAENGRQALDLIQRDGDYSLVVTDVQMPIMDGIQLTEAIRRGSTSADLPVIIVTSQDDEVHRQRGLEAGANAYMGKGRFDQQTLLEAVERLVGRAKG